MPAAEEIQLPTPLFLLRKGQIFFAQLQQFDPGIEGLFHRVTEAQSGLVTVGDQVEAWQRL